MKKVGKMIETHQQICLAHGIHLAVVKILYKKANYDQISENLNELPDFVDDDNDNDDDVDDEGGFSLQTTATFDVSDDDDTYDLRDDITIIIRKIRNVVKIFRRSPIKNDNLQTHVMGEFGKEITLLLDTKIRWNSMLIMVERFFKLKSCIQKSLIDLKIEFPFSEEDIDCVRDLISVLEPVKLSVEALCTADCSLLTADVSLKFMLDELTVHDSVLGNKLKEELINRILERRTHYSALLQYLNNPAEIRKTTNKCVYNIFNPLNRSTISKTIVSVIERLILKNQDDYNPTIGIDDEDDVDEVTEVNSSDISMKERLNMAIKKKHEIQQMQSLSMTVRNTIDLKKMVNQEMLLFEAQKTRPKLLEMAYKYIHTVKPTSVESERAFSAAGNIVTVVRSRLNDDTTDVLCFMRAFFQSQK